MTDDRTTAAELDDIAASLAQATRHLADARVGEEMTRLARARMSEVLGALARRRGSGPFDYAGMTLRVVEKGGRFFLRRAGRGEP